MFHLASQLEQQLPLLSIDFQYVSGMDIVLQSTALYINIIL